MSLANVTHDFKMLVSFFLFVLIASLSLSVDLFLNYLLGDPLLNLSTLLPNLLLALLVGLTHVLIQVVRRISTQQLAPQGKLEPLNLDLPPPTPLSSCLVDLWGQILKNWETARRNQGNQRRKLTQYLYHSLFLLLLLLILAINSLLARRTRDSTEFDFSHEAWSNLWAWPPTLEQFIVLGMILTTILEQFFFLLIVFWTWRWPVSYLNPDRPRVQETVLLIACHQSCLTQSSTESFRRTLRQALKTFPAGQIFVCDNGSSLTPVDQTQEVAYQVDPGIQYLYIPVGNKSHAMYWTSEYWISHLQRHRKLGQINWLVMIDDDVPLSDHLDLQLHLLDREVLSLGYGLTATTEDNQPNFWVESQDLEYKLAALVKYFGWQRGTSFCAHGAISAWRRDVLGLKSLREHDTVFHGEDLMMGVLAHEYGGPARIAYSLSELVPTFAPETLAILLRQRVFSWDLCNQRKFFLFLRLCFLGKWRYGGSWLKPLFLLEVLNIGFDWLRPGLLILGLVLTPRWLGLIFLFFCLSTWFNTGLLFQGFFLRHRPDLRVPWRAILGFPFYRLLLGYARWMALLQNALEYTPKVAVSRGLPEWEEKNQIPPPPPVINPDWRRIYQVDNLSPRSVRNLHGSDASPRNGSGGEVSSRGDNGGDASPRSVNGGEVSPREVTTSVSIRLQALLRAQSIARYLKLGQPEPIKSYATTLTRLLRQILAQEFEPRSGILKGEPKDPLALISLIRAPQHADSLLVVRELAAEIYALDQGVMIETSSSSLDLSKMERYLGETKHCGEDGLLRSLSDLIRVNYNQVDRLNVITRLSLAIAENRPREALEIIQSLRG